jgi:hypothetical protein
LSEVCALGARFFDSQRPAIERLSIQAGDGSLTILALREFDESEAAGHAWHPVANHPGAGHLEARAAHKFTQSLIRRVPREITNEEFGWHKLLELVESRIFSLDCRLLRGPLSSPLLDFHVLIDLRVQFNRVKT